MRGHRRAPAPHGTFRRSTSPPQGPAQGTPATTAKWSHGQPSGPYGVTYGQPGYYGVPAEPKSLSIASLCCGIAVLVGLGSSSCRRLPPLSWATWHTFGNPQAGALAIAGLVLGYVGLALTAILLIVYRGGDLRRRQRRIRLLPALRQASRLTSASVASGPRTSRVAFASSQAPRRSNDAAHALVPHPRPAAAQCPGVVLHPLVADNAAALHPRSPAAAVVPRRSSRRRRRRSAAAGTGPCASQPGQASAGSRSGTQCMAVLKESLNAVRGPGEVEVHQPGGAAVPDHHVLRRHVQVADQPGGSPCGVLPDRPGRKRMCRRHEPGRRGVQPAHQRRHGRPAAPRTAPRLRHGPGALARARRSGRPGPPSSRPRNRGAPSKPASSSQSRYVGDREGLRLVRAADGSAHPHHALGDVARRHEFDVGRLAGGGDVERGTQPAARCR